MSNKRQDKLFEQFSAYLDGELNDKQRSQVEQLLQENPALHEQFLQLEATRRLLRNAPRLKVPRNFTLTAAMLPQKKTRTVWVPVMSISSAVATILLVFSFIGNLAMASKVAPMAAQSNYAEAADSMAMPSEKAMQDTGAEKQEPPMIIQWFGNQAGGKGGGGPAGAVPQSEIMGEEAPAAAAPLPEAATPTVVQEPGAMESEGAPAFSLQAENPQADMSTQENYAGEPAATPMDETLRQAPEGQNLILGVAPTEDRGQIINEQTSETAPSGPEMREPVSTLAILRWILLVIALGSAVTAILMHRRYS